MHTIKNAKSMAKPLRTALAGRHISLSHGTCLEMVARQLGFADWNTLSATLPSGEPVEMHENAHCSFCGKHQRDVRSLVEGGCSHAQRGTANCVFICDECVALCATVNRENADVRGAEPA
jgi:hypothetical protein